MKRHPRRIDSSKVNIGDIEQFDSHRLPAPSHYKVVSPVLNTVRQVEYKRPKDKIARRRNDPTTDYFTETWLNAMKPTNSYGPGQ